MASQKKKLQKAAIKFRKENPRQHMVYSFLLFNMARFIKKYVAAEVTVGFDERGNYYEYANNTR